jgi:hypothetical protein
VAVPDHGGEEERPYYFIVFGSDIGICHGLRQQEEENEDE